MEDQSSFDFDVLKLLKQDSLKAKVLVFNNLLDSDGNPASSKSENSPVINDLLVLDLFKEFDDSTAYFSLLSKVAYIVQAPVDKFTPSLLSDKEYLKSTMPESELEIIQDSIYSLKVGFGSPDIMYKLDFYENQWACDWSCSNFIGSS